MKKNVLGNSSIELQIKSKKKDNVTGALSKIEGE